eukprot:TRINITY_DN1175_c0_g1_i2.p1 TRINITY_DN1175_c0_g1~~TRINITY_DN1175_c0_g1_i2.p1  ORF type:complete len:340 (-),score=118.38 TRINITY_DN1175_c0_g1_i2:132-1151(-)
MMVTMMMLLQKKTAQEDVNTATPERPSTVTDDDDDDAPPKKHADVDDDDDAPPKKDVPEDKNLFTSDERRQQPQQQQDTQWEWSSFFLWRYWLGPVLRFWLSVVRLLYSSMLYLARSCISIIRFLVSPRLWIECVSHFFSSSSSSSTSSSLSSSTVSSTPSFTLPSANEARQELQRIEREKEEIEKELNKLNQEQTYDFGKQMEYRSFLGNCYSFTQKQYTYSMCPYDKAEQKEGGSSTSLGKWKGWMANADAPTMEFTEGQKCWQGPARSLSTKLVCGSKNEVLSVDEPSKCVYAMVFATPAACSPEHAMAIRMNVEAQLRGDEDGENDVHLHGDHEL